LIIPIEIARRHGLEKPAHVVVQETPEGILIRRLEINDTSMQPAKVRGHSLITSTVNSTSSRVEDAL
jgi:bifunctional DNA-binding transcriptional regulator/antitoxin component of YhaV-PrlF toxin-antitoxin module